MEKPLDPLQILPRISSIANLPLPPDNKEEVFKALKMDLKLQCSEEDYDILVLIIDATLGLVERKQKANDENNK